jgi:nickel transport protein
MIIFPISFSAYGHGVKGKLDSGGIVVSAEYDDAKPMSYARVKISAPGTKLTFQSGRTDRNGRFCFFPDAPGDWNVVVDDEIGHRLEVPVAVDEAMELKKDLRVESSLSKYEKAIMGICIIFGISGVIFLLKVKNKHYKQI